MPFSSKKTETSKNPLNFSIGFQNIEGLHSDCECFLPEITENIKNDIHFLAETWSCNHDKEISGYKSFFKKGYKTPGVSTGRSSGGLLVYIKDNLQKHVKVLESTAYACWLEVDKNIFFNLDQNLIISAQYSPPINSKYNSQNSSENLKSDILKFCDENTPLVLIGDFNARTGNIPDNLEIDPNFDTSGLEQSEFRPRNNRDGTITSQGKTFIDTLISRNLRILNGRLPGDLIGNFTTFKNDHSSVNDYGVISDNLFEQIENFVVFPQTVFSDHAEIVISIKNRHLEKIDTEEKQEEWHPLENRYKWEVESLASMRENLENTPEAQLEDVMSMIQNQNSSEAARTLINIIENAIPYIQVRKKSGKIVNSNTKFRHKMKKKKQKAWFDKDLQDLKKITNKLSNLKHNQPGNLEIKHMHKESLKRYRDTCKAKKSNFRQEKFENMDKALSDSEELWKNFKSFSENRLPKSTVTEKISAKDWKSHFENLHSESRDQAIPLITENAPSKSLNKPFKMKELLSVIKKMKNKKAEGTDKIANEMIKNFPDKILSVILHLFNTFLDTGKIPEEWCEGLIAPIYKENDKNNPDNYRGICISNALLKCLCLMLNNRLKKFCAKNNLIAKEQIGFREKSRTTDHIFTLKTIVTHHLNSKKGNKVFACFIDLKKAYDSIHHEALFYKMKKIDINGPYLDLIKDLYAKTKCAIKVNGKRTDFFNYTKGVRQGCPLSPLLFNLFINGIVKCVNKYNPTPLKLDQNSSCLLYADDLVIFSSTREGLQKSIDAASNFFAKWNLSINYGKTKCMSFNKRGDKEKHIFTIQGNPLENVKSYKYLGITISCKNCSLLGTLNNLSVKANRALFSLKTNLNLMKMPIKLLLKIFDTMIVPILLYGAEVWVPSGKFTPEKWDKTTIEKQHTSLLKQILGVNTSTQNNTVRAEFGRLPLLVYTHARVWNYIKYLKNKTDSYAKETYAIDLGMENKNSLFKDCKYGIKQLIVDNIKKSQDPYNVSLKRVKLILKNDYFEYWKDKTRNSPTSASYATHKNSYEIEAYLTHVRMKKHRNSLAKLRLSDHQLHIQSGRQTRPKTPKEQRF